MYLGIDDFAVFFKDVHGYEPFMWQIKLVERVCKNGWPKALDMPTSSGKTAVIDIALFHLAYEFDKNPRNAKMRIALIVDRRLVVDHAFEHALKILNTLKRFSKTESHLDVNQKSATGKIAFALEKLSASSNNLLVTRLRGGMPQENDWVDTPSTPTIILSTIDQIGSRLLFRGYGVSNSMKPIHAGLLGVDTLYILDEAHTSQPFVDTIEQITKIQQQKKWKHSITSLFMSATLPPTQKNDVFPNNVDREELLYNMKDRITAHKYAILKKVKDLEDQIVKESCKFIQTKENSNNIKSVGIIVNRVNTARNIFTKMSSKINHQSNEVHLLTGRMRPLDRDAYIKEKIDNIKTNTNQKHDKVIFFVCTQCVEVGVDISFDVLITQIAPLDSLRQRFGRFNRLGSDNKNHAQIIATSSELSKKYDDPIYGNALYATWNYLISISNESKLVDFGIQHFKEPPLHDFSDMMSPKPKSVTLLPSYVHFWNQTNSLPIPDPEPALFLHGMKSKSADVQIIWRNEITEDMLSSKMWTYFFLVVPSTLEAISLPIWIIQKWLKGIPNSNFGDIELETPNPKEQNPSKLKRNVLRWRGTQNENTHPISPDQIEPGDIIIVPSLYGGCDKYGWNEKSQENVTDISMMASLIHKRIFAIKFDKKTITSLAKIDPDKIWKTIKNITIAHSENSNIKEFLHALKNIDGLPEIWAEIIEMLYNKSEKNIKIFKNNEPRIIGLRYEKRLPKELCDQILTNLFKFTYTGFDYENTELESSTDSEFTNNTSNEISLVSHSQGVEEHARMFCSKMNMDSNLSADIVLAAKLHDLGKAEKRVQALFHKLDPDTLDDTNLIIAKSKNHYLNSIDYNKYLDLAKLPKGYRHECWSVSLAKTHPDFYNAHDPDLVLYLIGTHHGYGRPLFPAVIDKYMLQNKILIQDILLQINYSDTPNGLDSDWIDMCEKLYEKYGPWNLAHMESIVRLADHRQSEKEANIVNQI